MTPYVRHLLGLALISLSLTAQALTAGPLFADTYTLGNQTLVLNGSGVRAKTILDVYAVALYVPAKDHTAATLMTQAGAKSLHIHMLRDMTGETIATTVVRGIRKNNSDAELAHFQAQVDELKTSMLNVGDVKKGTVVRLDYLPQKGTSVWINGVKRSGDMADEAFYAAILKVWLGDNPVDADVKKALLDL